LPEEEVGGRTCFDTNPIACMDSAHLCSHSDRELRNWVRQQCVATCDVCKGNGCWDDNSACYESSHLCTASDEGLRKWVRGQCSATCGACASLENEVGKDAEASLENKVGKDAEVDLASVARLAKAAKRHELPEEEVGGRTCFDTNPIACMDSAHLCSHSDRELRNWVRQQCVATCDVCKGNDCWDDNSACYESSHLCIASDGGLRKWVRGQCKATCGVCGGSATESNLAEAFIPVTAEESTATYINYGVFVFGLLLVGGCVTRTYYKSLMKEDSTYDQLMHDEDI